MSLRFILRHRRYGLISSREAFHLNVLIVVIHLWIKNSRLLAEILLLQVVGINIGQNIGIQARLLDFSELIIRHIWADQV